MSVCTACGAVVFICVVFFFQLKEQQTFLKKSVCHMGIGTPNRILALVKSGNFMLHILKLSNMKINKFLLQ